jgi:trans-2,3-dihydro-3-hydroxyanthranilate isomerase
MFYCTLDVFTDTPFCGNQLAVFPDARGLDTEQMATIAREFNLSETAFVFPPTSPEYTRRVRIFTPGAELPFAGHPTIGTAHALAALGEIPLAGETTHIVFEEGVGAVPVSIRSRDGVPVFAQLSVAKMPEIGPPPPSRSALADLLSIEVADLMGGTWSPQSISVGVPFLFVPVRDRNVLKRARVKLDRWEATLKASWAPEVFVFSRDPEREGSHIRARMFAPGLGIGEDAATGSAAASLGGYLAARDARKDGTLRWVVEQGFEMGRPSILEVEADKLDGKITSIRVGGASVMVSRGEMTMGRLAPVPV